MSNKNKPLYHYFKQLFAQVTNPPIDPIRESMVMSLVSFIGPKPNLLDTNNVNPPMRLEVSQPVLGFDDMARLRSISQHTGGKFKSYELDICYPVAWGKEGIEACLASLCCGGSGRGEIRPQHPDRLGPQPRSEQQVAIPALLATSTIHQHLVGRGLRASTGLVVETGSARETHHFALLAGYGAEAVHPYLALETLAELAHNLPHEMDVDKAITNYTKAIGKGLLKVMSKMGISTYMSYCGAQIFEAVGLNKSLVDKYFRGTSSNVEGIGLFEVAEEAHTHCTARPSATTRCWPMRWMLAASTPSACAVKSICGRRTPSPSCSTRPAPTALRHLQRIRSASSTTSPRDT